MLNVYRGLDESGNTVVFIDGDPDELLLKAAEDFSGNKRGEPADETTALLIGKIDGTTVNPVLEHVEKFVTPTLEEGTDERVEEELTKLNESLAKSGLRIIGGTTETQMVTVKKVDEATGEDVEEEEEQRTVLSVVLEPNDGEDGSPLDADTQGDIYSKEAVKNTAWGWMEKGGKIGLMHQLDITDKVAVLETYVALADFDVETTDGGSYKILKGVWVLRLKIYDDLLWQKALDGTLGAFSVGGTAQVETLEEGDDK